MSAFRKLSSIYVFSYFPFGFEGRIWDLIVSVPDHWLSFYLDVIPGQKNLSLNNDNVRSLLGCPMSLCKAVKTCSIKQERKTNCLFLFFFFFFFFLFFVLAKF